jgi:microcystin-dependent protein
MLAGSIYMFAGATAPTGFLMCDGSAVSRTTYSALFAVIGTTYGTGDGSTTFNLPDMSGRVPIGASSLHVLGTSGGEEGHVLLEAELPSHDHTVPAHGHGNDILAKTPSLSHSVTQQPAYTYNRPNSATKAGAAGSNAGYNGTSSTNASRTDMSITAHAASACTMGGSITDCSAFDTLVTGGGGAHDNMQPYITINYVICTEG